MMAMALRKTRILPNVLLALVVSGFPYGVEVERWLCNPRVSGSIPGAGNLEKLFTLDENSWTHTKTNSNRVIQFVS